MGYYQEKWMEKKVFLKSSLFIAVPITIVLFVVCILLSKPLTLKEILLMPVVFFPVLLYVAAFTTVFRMVFGSATGEGFMINAIRGLWVIIGSTFCGNMIGFAIGLCLLVCFVFLLAVYSIICMFYLPISSVYYYIRSKNECK